MPKILNMLRTYPRLRKGEELLSGIMAIILVSRLMFVTASSPIVLCLSHFVLILFYLLSLYCLLTGQGSGLLIKLIHRIQKAWGEHGVEASVLG